MAPVQYPPDPVTLFFGLLAAGPELFDPVETLLAKEFSPILERSATIPFTHSDYYTGEMGAGILRRWVAVECPIDPESLPGVKRHTNRIERVWAAPGSEAAGALRRRVNIDPGYLALSKVVLATCKDRDHRLYLDSGIFGEVTLSFKAASKSYEPFAWTYPDYRTPEAQEFFLRLRKGCVERGEAWRARYFPKE